MSALYQSVTVNGRQYTRPEQPLVVICCDGSEPAYMDLAMNAGLMPNLQRIVNTGTYVHALSAMPSFTNPNNLSIVTGQPPAVHGICGNYLIDPDTGQETMMNDPSWLRAPTIFAAFQQAGAKLCVITAKDKLRLLLGNGLAFDGSAVCFSSEKADTITMASNGIENICAQLQMNVPNVYSAELSEFVFAAGVHQLRTNPPDIMYLSTTDYIQHKFAAGSLGANNFYAMMDRYLGEIDQSGATIVIVADHGMKDKHLADGSPDVLFLQDLLDEKFGTDRCRVILPITDPYVAHHGALGSYAAVYVAGLDVNSVRDAIAPLDGIDAVHLREEACRMYALPEDRTGDLVVISGGVNHSKVLGTSRGKHDFSGLDAPLRSHGGLSEQTVPFISNRKLVNLPNPLRNFDAFFAGCNCLSGD